MRRWLLEHFKILIYTFCRGFLVFFGNIFSVFTLKDFDFNFYNFNKLRSFCLLFLFLFCTIFLREKYILGHLQKFLYSCWLLLLLLYFLFFYTFFASFFLVGTKTLFLISFFDTHEFSATTTTIIIIKITTTPTN